MTCRGGFQTPPVWRAPREEEQRRPKAKRTRRFVTVFVRHHTKGHRWRDRREPYVRRARGFFSQKHRFGAGQWLGEFVATFGLLSVIQGCVRLRSSAVPFAVGGYITAAYWFTSSTSFANPAVTIARTLSDTFTGIYPMQRARVYRDAVHWGGRGHRLFWWLVPAHKGGSYE